MEGRGLVYFIDAAINDMAFSRSDNILATVTVCDFKARRLSTASRRLMAPGAWRWARSSRRLALDSLIPIAGFLTLGRCKKTQIVAVASILVKKTERRLVFFTRDACYFD